MSIIETYESEAVLFSTRHRLDVVRRQGSDVAKPTLLLFLAKLEQSVMVRMRTGLYLIAGVWIGIIGAGIGTLWCSWERKEFENGLDSEHRALSRVQIGRHEKCLNKESPNEKSSSVKSTKYLWTFDLSYPNLGLFSLRLSLLGLFSWHQTLHTVVKLD